MKFYCLSNKKYVDKHINDKGLAFLYNNIFGRIILKALTTKFIANASSLYLNSKLSIPMIKKFIKKNNILMNEYENINYKSFNHFFVRKIKKEKRKIQKGFVSICDAKLSVYKIDEASSFKIKNSIYTIEELIRENTNKYIGGYALIFRLTADDYHHYIFPDSGSIIDEKNIKGILHTVQPLAFKKYKVFSENSRVVTKIDCDYFGLITYVEVGAMLIGKIVNNKIQNFQKGDEKGHFEFGGSTIILLVEKDKIKINKKIIENTQEGIETIVKMGENIE